MAMSRASVLLLGLVALTACATPPKGRPPGDPFMVAQSQAVELGKVLAGIRLCEGVAWQLPFNEFMNAKRMQGLDDIQASMIAAMVGTGEAQAEPAMLACTVEAAAQRQETIGEMRPTW
ncbi:MAG: hypothetical protein JNN33_09310 [Rhodospirillaceae bacterium]|jgi:hypothetical protein|nr:hypothetical protein [Rhodospirillaceae bacterium]